MIEMAIKLRPSMASWTEHLRSYRLRIVLSMAASLGAVIVAPLDIPCLCATPSTGRFPRAICQAIFFPVSLASCFVGSVWIDPGTVFSHSM
jgi:hypothetical protein